MLLAVYLFYKLTFRVTRQTFTFWRAIFLSFLFFLEFMKQSDFFFLLAFFSLLNYDVFVSEIILLKFWLNHWGMIVIHEPDTHDVKDKKKELDQGTHQTYWAIRHYKEVCDAAD